MYKYDVYYSKYKDMGVWEKIKKIEHERIQWNLHTEFVETVSCTFVGIQIILSIRSFINRSKFKKLT